MKYANFSASVIIRRLAVVFSKMMLCILAVFSMMLFVAVAEGGVNLFIGLGLGVLVLLASNVFCGIILPVDSDAPIAAAVQPVRHMNRQPSAVVPLRVVRGGRAA